MKIRIKIALAILLTVLVSIIDTFGLSLMNISSDSAVATGLCIVLLMFILYPSALYRIFRKKKVNESTQKSTK